MDFYTKASRPKKIAIIIGALLLTVLAMYVIDFLNAVSPGERYAIFTEDFALKDEHYFEVESYEEVSKYRLRNIDTFQIREVMVTKDDLYTRKYEKYRPYFSDRYRFSFRFIGPDNVAYPFWFDQEHYTAMDGDFLKRNNDNVPAYLIYGNGDQLIAYTFNEAYAESMVAYLEQKKKSLKRY